MSDKRADELRLEDIGKVIRVPRARPDSAPTTGDQFEIAGVLLGWSKKWGDDNQFRYRLAIGHTAQQITNVWVLEPSRVEVSSSAKPLTHFGS